MTGELIKIELTNEDALLFKKFREYQDIFKKIYDAGALSVKNGNSEINFTFDGAISSIKISTVAYRQDKN